MTPRTENRADHERDNTVSQVARRIDRDIRRTAERRRAAFLAVSLAAVGVALLAGGLSVAMARGDRTAVPENVSNTAPISIPTTIAESMAPIAAPATEKLSSPKVKDAPPPPSGAETVAKSAKAVSKSAKRPPAAAKPARKPQARQPGIVIRKCGRCHSDAQVSAGKLDLESATSSVDGMIAGGYVKLTAQERVAVIAGLTGK